MYSYEEIFNRTGLLIGEEKLKLVRNSSVVVTGVGGVGSFAAEALSRAGVGRITLIDPDEIDVTNINRQIHSAVNTVGRLKVEVMAERIMLINPEAHVKAFACPFEPGLIPTDAAYVVDAIDGVRDKINLIKYSMGKNIPVISSMGMGNKMEPSLIKVATIGETRVCPLAKIIRREMKRLKLDNLKVVYSEEVPLRDFGQRGIISSISFVPSVAGLLMASEVIKDIIGGEGLNET